MRGQIADCKVLPENLLNLARLVRIARCDNQLHARILVSGSSRSSMSSERRKSYPFDQIEPKWQAIWEERQLFHAPNPGEKGFDPAKRKFYILDMFPYPSGAGLHGGHHEGYTATDIIPRSKRMRGFSVLHPMGWTHSVCPRSNTRSKPASTPQSRRAKTSRNSRDN